MLDQIESWENAAEAWAAENIKGLEYGFGSTVCASSSGTHLPQKHLNLSPVCIECFEKWVKQIKKEEDHDKS